MDCLFCKIIQGEIPSTKVYEDDDIYAFHDIAPQAPIHILVIPKKHLHGPEAVKEEDERVVGKMVRLAKEIADKEGIPHYRLVFNNGSEAGQTVFHLHMHILGGRFLGWPPG
ncbi:MAG: histidine triad nucleotide-binding protein [Desulfobulbus sp.]|jgi:histidine triad (HIT) family protein